nr:CHAD domain-containing protein [Streptomyces sp. NRRL F-5135]
MTAGDRLTAGEVLAGYLHARAGDFLRGVRLYEESGADAAAAESAARSLRGSARRIGGALHTFRPLLDPGWADQLVTELGWLTGTLAQEQACANRLHRLMGALARLSVPAPPVPAPVPAPAAVPVSAGGGRTGRERGERAERGGRTERQTAAGPSARGGFSAPSAAPGPSDTSGTSIPSRPSGPSGPSAPSGPPSGPSGTLAVGASRAGALLERRLTLARTRAHSAALQALGSSRFHAVADSVAVLASEVPLAPIASAPAAELLPGPAGYAERRLLDAVSALPLTRAAHPYNAEALVSGLATTADGETQDAPWHHVRQLLRLHRYAQEIWCPAGTADPVLTVAGQALDRHRDAAEAAAAAANAARTPRIAPATAYALGVLHADQRHEVEAARYAFQRVWQEATVTKP